MAKRELSGRLQQMKFMQRGKVRDEAQLRQREQQQDDHHRLRQEPKGDGTSSSGGGGGNPSSARADGANGAATAGAAATPAVSLAVAAAIREEHWVLPQVQLPVQSVRRSCVVVIEGDPRPGALLGRMSFRQFNPVIEKLTDEIEAAVCGSSAQASRRSEPSVSDAEMAERLGKSGGLQLQEQQNPTGKASKRKEGPEGEPRVGGARKKLLQQQQEQQQERQREEQQWVQEQWVGGGREGGSSSGARGRELPQLSSSSAAATIASARSGSGYQKPAGGPQMGGASVGTQAASYRSGPRAAMEASQVQAVSVAAKPDWRQARPKVVRDEK